MRRPSPLLLQSIAAPAAVLALAALLWAFAGAAMGARRCSRSAGARSSPITSSTSIASTSWARCGLDAAVPEGVGVWRAAFSALYRACAHAPRARARPHAHHRALPERRRGDSRRHGRARHAEPHQVGERARAVAARPRSRATTWARRSSTSCASRSSCATSDASDYREPRDHRLAPRRGRDARDPDRAVRHRRRSC